jgi:hypothetical protein
VYTKNQKIVVDVVIACMIKKKNRVWYNGKEVD